MESGSHTSGRTTEPYLNVSHCGLRRQSETMNFLDHRVPECIWKRLTLCQESECWLWDQPHRLKFKVTIEGKQRPAHLVIYTAYLGHRPNLHAGNRLVRRCGNDICCNPEHLAIEDRCKKVTRDLVGMTFGYLSVVERAPGIPNSDGGIRKMWLCKCACGVLKTIREENLLGGEARSCGCMRYELLVKPLDVGRTYGFREVLSRVTEKKNRRGALWNVRCVCGREQIATSTQLKRNDSCGCRANYKHGFSPRNKPPGDVVTGPNMCRTCGVSISGKGARYCTPECRKQRSSGATRLYRIWCGMKARCLNPMSPAFHHYGGRGILVCPSWAASFDVFRADVGEPPPGMSLDRIDPNGNYEPSNVRWATQSEQMQNTRTARARVARVLDAFKDKDPSLIAELKRELLGAS